MSRLEVEQILSKSFPDTALVPMLDDYEAIIKNLFLRNYDTVLIFGGRMVENLFICLSTLTGNPVTLSPNFNKIQKDLEQIPEAELPSSIRVIAPRAAKTLYDLRSRRGAVHVNPTVSPGYIDATFAVSLAQWILAELVRVFSDWDSNRVSVLIHGLVDRKLPIVEEITGVPVILESDISAHDSILVILYSHYPNPISKASLAEFLPEFTKPNIRTSLRNAEKEKLVFRNGDNIYLTRKGVMFVEDKYGGRYFGGHKDE